MRTIGELVYTQTCHNFDAYSTTNATNSTNRLADTLRGEMEIQQSLVIEIGLQNAAKEENFFVVIDDLKKELSGLR